MLVFSRIFLLGILIFKELTARRLYKSFAIKGLNVSSNQDTISYHNVLLVVNALYRIRGCIQNIPDWYRHLYSNYGSVKHR
jgi:hypothetical protein